MTIETWNITTLKIEYRIDILLDEFKRFGAELWRVSKIPIPGVGSIKLDDIEYIYSGRNDGIHRQRIRLKMNKKAAKSCLGKEGIDNRILIANVMTKSLGYQL
jgi:hypothetical protein